MNATNFLIRTNGKTMPQLARSIRTIALGLAVTTASVAALIQGSISTGSFDHYVDTVSVSTTPGFHRVGHFPAGKNATCIGCASEADIEPPSLTIFAPEVVASNLGMAGAVVTYYVLAEDNRPGVTVVSTPPSGTTFPEGVTIVTTVATDKSANSTTNIFTVTVSEPH